MRLRSLLAKRGQPSRWPLGRDMKFTRALKTAMRRSGSVQIQLWRNRIISKSKGHTVGNAEVRGGFLSILVQFVATLRNPCVIFPITTSISSG